MGGGVNLGINLKNTFTHNKKKASVALFTENLPPSPLVKLNSNRMAFSLGKVNSGTLSLQFMKAEIFLRKHDKKSIYFVPSKVITAYSV